MTNIYKRKISPIPLLLLLSNQNVVESTNHHQITSLAFVPNKGVSHLPYVHQSSSKITPAKKFPTKPIISSAFDITQSTPSTTRLLNANEDNDDEEEKGSPWELNIPIEYREEILQAERNTPAAKERQQRVILYVAITLFGIGITSLNALFTAIRGDMNDIGALSTAGFSWVGDGSNPFISFFFLNKIGGGLALLSAGVCGTLLEMEQRAGNDNAEKIWQELQRRKEANEKKTNKKKKNQKRADARKLKRKQKQNKRLGALSEVMMDDATTTTTTPPVSDDGNDNIEEQATVTEEVLVETQKNDGNIFSQVKDFYEKADTLAASQALLLNKELEDRGILEKITDESGLVVKTPQNDDTKAEKK